MYKQFMKKKENLFVARILEAEICGAENVCAIIVYNQYYVLY